ncbi:SOH1-domain-containing protein [Radiomyces spectabilis]|uniref:SOH1-domain-containing protein n=1 Tax=Radiomyces spectabilis TaxID=64574 RepID=UPI0022207AB4|nr:SOH1-domain-containing protein [Radiomyces spectabilis]KAI8385010.1 SOH1-domain-containing protein [Radiomyces spectabilis]
MVQLNAEEEKRRFQIELEFLNCLANPWYLNNLAQQQYFKDPAFIRYLEYLQYWKQPEYAKFVVYPHSLYFLDLLQHEQFREHISTSENTQETHRMQYYHWMYLRNGPEGQVKQTEETVTNTTAPEPTADSTAVAALDSLPPA